MMTRALLIALLLLPHDAEASRLRVIVHTQQHEVVVTVRECTPMILEEQDSRSVVRTPGYTRWQARGGEPPYSVIDWSERDGAVHVTIRDAAGSIASGSARVRAHTEYVYLPCEQDPLNIGGITAKSPKDTTPGHARAGRRHVRSSVADQAGDDTIGRQRKGGGSSTGTVRDTRTAPPPSPAPRPVEHDRTRK